MLLDRLKAEETRREELIRELEQIDAAGHVGSLDEARFKRELKARLADMRGTSRSTCVFCQTAPENALRAAAALREGGRGRCAALSNPWNG